MEIKRIFVVGAGLMGSGIAQTAIQGGYNVLLFDANEDVLLRGAASIRERLASRVAKDKMSQKEADSCISRLTLAKRMEDAADSDLVIEAIYESSEAKHTVFKKLSQICRPDCILASNTSSISLTALSASVSHPERFIGMHFFSPVPVMKLLEITMGLRTSQDTLSDIRTVGENMGKVMIVAKDMPGFIVNRMLDPMLNEAIQILDENIGSVEDIDNGMKFGCNHPMGPLELADMAGLDILLAVMEVFYAELGDSKYRPAPLLRKMVRAGFTGKKAGIGFYLYDKEGKKTNMNPALCQIFTKP